jgi:Cu/Ag efflux protein CusF
MRHLFAAIIALLTMNDVVFAGEAEGAIKTIDRDAMTITLENGKAYKLPGEFDVDKIKEGMDVIIAYDEINGEKLITDMEAAEQ